MIFLLPEKSLVIIAQMNKDKEKEQLENGGYLHAEIEGESPLALNEKRNLVIKAEGVAEKMPAGVEKKLDIIVHTNGSVVLYEDDDWHQKLDVEKEEGVTFILMAAGLGEARVTVSAFYQRHWLSDINFDLKVE